MKITSKYLFGIPSGTPLTGFLLLGENIKQRIPNEDGLSFLNIILKF